MEEFEFLTTYIDDLPVQERDDPEFGFVLGEGIDESEIRRLESQADIEIPEELKDFYSFSYGARLSEFEILTIDEIVEQLAQARTTYEEYWRDDVLPFAYVAGVGDLVAFKLSEADAEGRLLVLDGFHELPPAKWKGICHGLKKWLQALTENGFERYW
jgi:hypothetical protein